MLFGIFARSLDIFTISLVLIKIFYFYICLLLLILVLYIVLKIHILFVVHSVQDCSCSIHSLLWIISELKCLSLGRLLWLAPHDDSASCMDNFLLR